MGFNEMMAGFQDRCDGICDIFETCEVCGGYLYDEFGRSLKRQHMQCRYILAMERGQEG